MSGANIETSSYTLLIATHRTVLSVVVLPILLFQTGSVELLVPAVLHLKNNPSTGTEEGLLISPTLYAVFCDHAATAIYGSKNWMKVA